MNKKLFETQKNAWENEVTSARLEYPDEHIVRFLARRKSKGGAVLDMGCGAGRNAVAAAKMGFSVTAADYNQACLDITAERLAEVTKDFRTFQNEGHLLDAPDEAFDLAFSWGVLFLMEEAEAERYLKELCRVLKPGGELFADFRAQNDYLYGKGEKLAENLFALGGESGRPGLVYHFYSIDLLRPLFARSGFEITNAERFEFTQNNGADLNAWLHITAKKA